MLVLKALKILANYKKEYGYLYFLVGSYREGESSEHSDIDFVVIGEHYPTKLFEKIKNVKRISVHFYSQTQVANLNFETPNAVKILDPYFRYGLPGVNISNELIFDLHLASFKSLISTFSHLKELDIIDKGILIQETNQLSFRFIRLFDRFIFNLFLEDPYKLHAKKSFSIDKELQENKYLTDNEKLNQHRNLEFKIKNELIACFDRLVKSEKYSSRASDSYINNMRFNIKRL